MDDNTKNHAEFLILSHMIFVDTFVALLATQARKQSASTLRIKDKKRCENHEVFSFVVFTPLLIKGAVHRRKAIGAFLLCTAP